MGCVSGGPTVFAVKDWPPYDKLMEEMLLDRCTSLFAKCFAAFLYYISLCCRYPKLRLALWIARASCDLDLFVSGNWGDVVKFKMLALSHRLDGRRLRAYPSSQIAFVRILPFSLLLARDSPRYRAAALIAVAALFPAACFRY
jgi:hypothetical protein